MLELIREFLIVNKTGITINRSRGMFNRNVTVLKPQVLIGGLVPEGLALGMNGEKKDPLFLQGILFQG
jgi:hypothetical protein